MDSDSLTESLMLSFLEWIGKGGRGYEDVMEAWRTSCPRFPIWEDANDRGLVITEEVNGQRIVRITRAGLTLVERHRTSAD